MFTLLPAATLAVAASAQMTDDGLDLLTCLNGYTACYQQLPL